MVVSKARRNDFCLPVSKLHWASSRNSLPSFHTSICLHEPGISTPIKALGNSGASFTTTNFTLYTSVSLGDTHEPCISLNPCCRSCPFLTWFQGAPAKCGHFSSSIQPHSQGIGYISLDCHLIILHTDVHVLYNTIYRSCPLAIGFKRTFRSLGNAAALKQKSWILGVYM
jgi:hypothetical protein